MSTTLTAMSTDATVTKDQDLKERRDFVRGFPSFDVLEDNSKDAFKTFLALLLERRSSSHRERRTIDLRRHSSEQGRQTTVRRSQSIFNQEE